MCRFKYAVSPAAFVAKVCGRTCTLVASDPADVVIHRENYLLNNGFVCYNLFKNNCEDFVIYCKTGLVVVDGGMMGQSGQAALIVSGPVAPVLSTPLRFVTTNVYGMVVLAAGVYCASLVAADIGMRKDMMKINVEDLTRMLSIGALRMGEAADMPTTS